MQKIIFVAGMLFITSAVNGENGFGTVDPSQEKAPIPAPPVREPRLACYTIALSNDEKWIVTGSDDGAARVWDVDTGKEVKAFVGHDNRDLHGFVDVEWAQLSPDNKLLATCDRRSVYVWDVATMKQLWSFREPGLTVLRAVFSHSGKQLAICGNDRKARIFDLESKKVVKEFEHPSPVEQDRSVVAAFFSHDDKMLVTFDIPTFTPRIWSIATGKVVSSLDRSRFECISADGKWMLIRSNRSKVQEIIALGKGEKGFELAASREFPKGQMYVSWSSLISSGEDKWTLIGTVNPNSGIRADADGGLPKWVPCIARLVDFASNQELLSIKMPATKEHAAFPQGMALSRDGKRFFTVSSDGIARSWDVKTGLLIREYGKPLEKKTP